MVKRMSKPVAEPATASRPVPRPFAMPWGAGQIVEEAAKPTPWHEPTIQLLRYDDGAEALRFCYYHGPRFGRGPMMVNKEAIDRFAEALRETPRIRALLRCMLGEQP
ncbi:MAG: hypothetical protein FJ318_01505 [SAR202 cluster bacterium]|nr:hypothetical protein [SAR202 cluster bacterium]